MLVLAAAALAAACNEDPSVPGDTTPPAAVADLTAQPESETVVRLAWTAPGDDGTAGRAALYDIRRLNGPITSESWGQAVPVATTLPFPDPAGTVETLLVLGLAPGQAYWFAVRAADESANWSEVSNPATTSTLDLVAPSRVLDLAVQSAQTTDSAVTLAWTAPGDDGAAGQAAIYDLRYATAPITEANFAAATPVSPQPLPPGDGFQQSLTIRGLLPATDYWFALRAADEVPNWSPLSNVAHASTRFIVRSPSQFISRLAKVYGDRNRGDYASLLAPEGEGVDFQYLLYQALPGGEISWGRGLELEIHGRMFAPEDPAPGDPPVPSDLWPSAIAVSLAPLGSFAPRTDLGLPAKWKAWEAAYHADLLFDLQGPIDYRVDGRCVFIVLEDTTLPSGSEGKFRLYRWEDLGSPGARTAGVEAASWSAVKSLYRVDRVAPAAVADLRAEAVGDLSIALSWTAPGDGFPPVRVTTYDLRYATSPITDESFLQAPSYPVSAPREPGTLEQIAFSGAPSTVYWFALRSADRASNWSFISNVVSAQTGQLTGPAAVVEVLRVAYLNRDFALYSSLFTADGEGVDFVFILNDPDPVTGDTDWGRTEEVRIHRRMFDPESPQPGETPVPAELRLQSIAMSLTPIRAFTERTDLNLPPKWKAWEGQYHPNILFDLQGSTDYAVDGRSNFIVVEDTTLPTGNAGKFLLYRWEDLGSFANLAAASQSTWSDIKGLYR